MAQTTGTLSERVAQFIRAEIVAKRLQPGDALPGEIELARQLGVSRGIVREGRRQLVAAGLIDVTNGRRAVVSKLGAGPLDGFLANAVATRQLAVSEVLELRQALEIAVAGFAAERRTEADIAELSRLLDRMRTAVGTPGYLKHDLAFHLALARATHNPLFVLLIESIREAMMRSMRASHARRRSARSFAEAQAMHESLFEAVQTGDAAAAESAMRAHFANVAATLEDQAL
jgi:GntR family transcriptional regulator, transcriptional repressor for pyruvate dehydrogenase complex